MLLVVSGQFRRGGQSSVLCVRHFFLPMSLRFKNEIDTEDRKSFKNSKQWSVYSGQKIIKSPHFS